MGQVANIDTANSADVSMWAYDSVGSAAAKALVRTVPVPADAATTFLTGKLVLEANDYIFGLASANDHLDVTVSILEIT
jgi:maltose-binding protein MalE